RSPHQPGRLFPKPEAQPGNAGNEGSLERAGQTARGSKHDHEPSERIHRRLSKTCRKCGIPTRYSELSPFEPNTSAGVVRSGFIPRDQLPRSGVQTCGTRK
ncbi:hypothetical protein pipiens_000295, partial [Culex pipiens pipiens]